MSTINTGYHVQLKNVPGAEGLLFYSATTPSATIDAPKFATWSDPGATINSVGGGRQVQWAPITLMRGVDKNKKLNEWFTKTATEKGHAKPPDLEIIVLDGELKPLHTWNLVGAHITGYSDSGHNAQSSDPLVETVTIEYERAELK